MMPQGDDALTDQAFWDSFWGTVRIPDAVDPKRLFDRCLVRLLDRYLAEDSSISLVEIGCAPGRWLIYCHQRFGFQVAGFEFAPQAAATTRKNLAFHHVPAELWEGDFLTRDLPEARFDVVLSLGFIEHFTNPQHVFDRHARLLKPGGTLVVEVPNLRGINRLILRLTGSKLLQHHNLEIMKVKAFRSMAATSGLEILEIGYFGGFEPALSDAIGASLFIRLIIGALSRSRSPWMDSLNAAWLSGYLYGVFRKPYSANEAMQKIPRKDI